MNKPLYLFVGRSASGKTTIANMLESQYDFCQLQSYTTRPKRSEDEIGHIFVTNDEFDKLENIIAYTEYNSHKYCATKEQIDAVDIYVIDPFGVKTLLAKYDSDRPIVIIYFDTSIKTRIDRMINRHDSDMSIVSRLYNDEAFDWEEDLYNTVLFYKDTSNKTVTIYTVDANKNMDDVMDQVHTYMTLKTGGLTQ